jgi:GH24 family phage-related lysozyme (muramidase)
MSSRREVVSALILGGLGAAHPWAHASSDAEHQFDELLRDALADEEGLRLARQDREGERTFFEAQRGPGAPRIAPSTRTIGPKAISMIIGFEVSSPEHYQKSLKSPIWPGGKSGVTIGVGYDLGYHTYEWVQEDWGGIVPDETIASLKPACLVTGKPAQDIVKNFSKVSIDWESALKQFQKTGLPRYTAQTLQKVTIPANFNDECLGAIVSLVMNRGATFHNRSARYVEMSNIADRLKEVNYPPIPDEIRKMTRLWTKPAVSDEDAKALRGLVIRRNLEAKLFELGLEQSGRAAKGA